MKSRRTLEKELSRAVNRYNITARAYACNANDRNLSELNQAKARVTKATAALSQ